MIEANGPEAFFGLQALRGAAEELNVTALEEEHPRLIREIAAFDRTETLALVSGLLTLPQFHENTIRLELLQHFVHRNALGKNKPTRNRIAQWLNQELGRGWASRMEDPVEDVFLSNVVSSVGNRRIFEGIWEANDFWLQETLNAMGTLRDEPWANTTLDQCFALLNMSEALAERCGLARYCMGGGSVRTSIDPPPQAELNSRAALVRFSRLELDEIEVSMERLEPFIHDDSPAQGGVGKSTLERRPLVRDGNGIIVAIPAAISPAIRLYIADEVIRAGAEERFERMLFSQQLDELFNEGVRALGATLIDPSGLLPLPTGTPATVQELVEFDKGKFAHVIFFEDRILGFLQTGLGGVLELSDNDAQALYLHCQNCAKAVAKRSGYSGGLTIAIHGGLGRGFVFGARELPEHWHLTGFHLHDFIALGRVRRTDLLRIWKLMEQESDLHERGVRITNINGELNLLGYWQSNGERLVPRDAPPSGVMLNIGTNFIAQVRRELRSMHDLHAVARRNPSAWVPVRRYNVDPFFKEVASDPIYADAKDAARGRLRGVIETSRRSWWVSSIQRHRSHYHRDVQFRIWNALLEWMPGISSVAEETITTLPVGPIEIFLHFDSLEGWTTQRIDDLPSAEEADTLINQRLAAVRVTLPLGFLRHFATQFNVAERKLIRACFTGFAALSGTRLDTLALDALVQSVVRNDDARFFHLAFAQNIRQRLHNSDRPKPRFVSEGEINFACVGLAQRILGHAEMKSLNGASECNQFLHTVVDECWIQLRTILEKRDPDSVIYRALQNVEAIEHDKQQWEMTASALLATHDNREDVIDAAHNRERDRAGAELASRIIVEMAICTCPIAGGDTINDADFDRMLGIVRLLLYAANSSDAIQYGLASARIQIFANGEFSIDDAYSENVVQPYMEEQFTEQFAAAASSYSDYFREPGKTLPETKGASFAPAFDLAFRAEYGISTEDLISAYITLEEDALHDALSVVRRSQCQVREAIAAAGLSADVPDRLFDHFSLWAREAWDKTPKGFTAKDWYPWRFRRRLSLLARPFVLLGEGDDGLVIFAPGIIHDSLKLLFARLLSGQLPAEDFQSSQMRSWIGEATRQRGDEFEDQVAEQLRAAGLNTMVRRPLTEFGADESYGDIDVLAWGSGGNVVYLIECKRLRFARTVAEIGEQLREFKGEEMDRLARHVRRCQWLESHQDAVRRVTHTSATILKLVPLLITSTAVPMQFSKELPIPPERIMSLSRLREWIARQRIGG